MATPSHAQAVKSLNKSPGRRRFVFKSISQRLEEIDIDVYRSLDKVKSEPTEGSTFSQDCLIEWRELNTAEDFISLYEEIMPYVQTLPLLLLHKELIVSKLLYRLHMRARLSLEPILRLMAALSRDLLEDFLPFLSRIVDSLVSLLESGADREPEIIEQIVKSWSYIIIYLQRYLMQNIVHVLKVTIKLRYYPKDYVQELVAAATSFLLRNVHDEQLEKGVRKIMLEVVKKPLITRKYGVSALVCYAMTGTSSRLHSRARRVLRLLMHRSIFMIGDKFNQDPVQGSDIVVEVVIMVFQRLSEELESKELNLMWECLHKEIQDCLADGCLLHLSRMLSLFISAVQINDGRGVPDYQRILELVGYLVQTFVKPLCKEEDNLSNVVDKILQLMLCILDGLYSFNDISAISDCSFQWAPVFELPDHSLLPFIKELLRKDPCIIYAFGVNILSAMINLMKSSNSEVIFLLWSLCERLQTSHQISNCWDKTSEGEVSKTLQHDICNWVRLIDQIADGSSSCAQIEKSKLAILWGSISCYPHFLDVQTNPSILMDLIGAIDRLLMTGSETVSGVQKRIWQSLIGASLSSFLKCPSDTQSKHENISKVLYLAGKYKSSSQVLLAVAEYLDFVQGPKLQAESNSTTYHPELDAEKTLDAVGIFADNLVHSDKGIRLPTLRILCHYAPLNCKVSSVDALPRKKIKTEVSETCLLDNNGSNVLQLLLAIEATPHSISTSRKVILLISQIQMGISAGKISETCIPLVLNGMIGIFYNRFSSLWNPASECLAVLISKHVGLVWDQFICYVEQCQSKFQASFDQLDGVNADMDNESSDLVEPLNLFVNAASDSTPHTTVLSLLLQSLQKIPFIAESHSRHVVPLFLKFLGYQTSDPLSVDAFSSYACKGKDWKSVLSEWLNLLKLMQNPRSFFRSQFLKDVLENRLLDENDADIQMKVLDCLLMWKDDFLLLYDQHLKNLISSKSLREELTTWSLTRESHLIERDHRAYLVPIVICLLMPKVRKLKTLASRKHASIHHRKAVLAFIAQLDVDELPLFFFLLIKPLQIIPTGIKPLLNNSMGEFQGLNFFKYFTVENITVLSEKKIYGFLHVIEGVVEVFDEMRIRPFLDLLMGCVVRVLLCCNSSLDIAKSAESSSVENHCSVSMNLQKTETTVAKDTLTCRGMKHFKDLRSLCLKIVSAVLNKYEDNGFSSEFWDLFFASVKPLIDGFKKEGFSSEKPSSLFSCFLAMSRSSGLVSLLCREESLVTDILSILTVTAASEAIISGVLKFIENLLNLDSELDDDNCPVKEVLYLNLETLISSLHCFYHSDTAIKRKLIKYHGETQIRILKMLSKYIKDPAYAKKFADILLPFLAKRPKDMGGCLEVLQIIRDIVPALRSEDTANILDAVSSLLVSAELNVRLSICDLLDALAKTDCSLHVVAKFVRELNASSSTEVDSLDYDMIFNAYSKINADFFYTIQEDHALVVLSHCVHDMSSEELVLRNCAFKSLLSFVEFSAVNVGCETAIDGGIPEARITCAECCWTRAGIKRMISKFLLKHLGDAMNQGSAVKKVWIDLLREMVLKLPDELPFNSFKALCSEDAEVDFFRNIIHLQKHMRARALTRFRNIISISNMSEDILNKIFVPLFFNILIDIQDGKGEHVRNACLETLAAISARMDWMSYYELLMRCFRELKMNPDKQKFLLRLICLILEQFHFSQVCSSEAVDGNSNLSAMTLKRCRSVMYSQIQTSLHKTVLPKIQNLMNADSDKVNVHINLAALKILKLLPGDIMDSQLPSIIYRISNFLKNRLESVRDEARLALASCLKELGLEYLQFIIGVMRATLKRGYELHVLGYTLNFILSKCVSNLTNGRLDYCLEDLLVVVENDILGDVAGEKEVEKIASKMKETKKHKSFGTLKLIAQNISFKSHALKLLSPVTAQFTKHLTPKLKTKLENMLNHIAAGIEGNPSVHQKDLFIFIYGIVEDGINEENGLGGKLSNSEASKNVSGQTTSLDRVVGGRSVCSHLITVFAVGLLHNRIKNVKLDKDDRELVSMLDPFVKLLGNCLSSRYEDVISASLKCLTALVRLPLPSLERADQADKIKATLLDIAQGSLNSSSPLMQSCLKLLTVLLRSTGITLSSEKLHMLIQFPIFVDLERDASFAALSLLKAIVKRKLVVHEMYDIVRRVGVLMVTSQIEPIRKKCSQILLQFLLEYRLSGERLQEQLNSLLANLRYEHSAGREAVLEMLHTIIIKFPKSIVDEQSQTLFLRLVACLANDQDIKVRSMSGAAIKLLIGRISKPFLQSILEYGLSWYLGEKQQLWSTGAQVLGLFIEVMKKDFQRLINKVLPRIRSVLQSSADMVTSEQLDLSDDVIPLWKEAYYSLIMLEKMLHQFNEMSLEKDLEDVWEAICRFLLHPHSWLRNISSRLLSLYFTAVASAGRDNHEKSLGTYLLMRPTRLFMIAVSFCCQLKGQLTNDAAASNLIIQNLVFAICGVHSLMRKESKDPNEFWSNIEQQDQRQLLTSFQLLDSTKGRGMFLSVTSGVCDRVDKNQCDVQYLLVSDLLKELGKIALQMEAIQMKIVFNIFRGVSSHFSQEECGNYAFQLLLPLYKVSEGFSGKVISDELKQLAQEVNEAVQKIIGNQKHVEIYNEIRKKLKSKRDKRKQEEKVMAVVNPMRNAKRKLRIAAKHRAHKKRKMMTMKMGRWI